MPFSEQRRANYDGDKDKLQLLRLTVIRACVTSLEDFADSTTAFFFFFKAKQALGGWFLVVIIVFKN